MCRYPRLSPPARSALTPPACRSTTSDELASPWIRSTTSSKEFWGHLIRCIVYIDLNMVRAGVVRHPSEWIFGGYTEIQNPKQRYSIVNRRELANLLGIKDEVRMMEVHRQWVDALLKDGSNKRDARWTESIAVGDKEFVLETKARLGAKALGRKISEGNGHYELRESHIPYSPLFALEKCRLSSDNSYSWEILP